MIIERESVYQELETFFTRDKGIIYGAPGSGKSYLVSKYTEERLARDEIVFLVQVDKFSTGTDEELKEFYNLETDLLSFLSATPIIKNKKIIIFDGIDAARNPEVEERFLLLIDRCIINLGNWSVFAVVREFDLLKNSKIRETFNITYHEKSLQLLKLSELNPGEIHEGLGSIGLTESNISNILSEEVAEFLSIPFNLWLFSELKNILTVNDLGTIQTEVELLDLYRINVVGSDQTRIEVLSSITKEMVINGTLNVDTVFIDSEKKHELELLIKIGILEFTSDKFSKIRFRHNLFFDYFASIYYIEQNPSRLVDFVKQNEKAPVFLYQSFRLYFSSKWLYSRLDYWKITEELLACNDVVLKLIAKTVLIHPIISSLNNVNDLDYILLKKDSVETFLKYYLFGLESRKTDNLKIRVSVLEKIYEYADGLNFWNLTRSLCAMIKADDFSSQQGRVSELLLKFFAKTNEDPDNVNYSHLRSVLIVPAIIKSLEFNKDEKVNILKAIADNIGKPGYSVKEVYNISSNIISIIDNAPALAGKIYIDIFSYEEQSKDDVEMGSAILSLKSNLKQDYKMAHYQLYQSFSHFLNTDFEQSFIAGVLAGEAEIYREHNKDDDTSYIVKFNGTDLEIVEDYSYIWGAGSRIDDYGVLLIDKCFSFLESRLEEEEYSQEKVLDEVFSLFNKSKRAFYTLTKLIELSERFPISSANLLEALVTSESILFDSSYGFHMNTLIRSGFVELPKDSKITLEQLFEKRSQGEEGVNESHLVDAFINSIDIDKLETSWCKKRKSEIDVNTVYKPFLNRIDASFVSISREERLREEGVDLSKPKIDQVISLLDKFTGVDDQAHEELRGLLLDIQIAYRATSDINVLEKILTSFFDVMNKWIFKIKDWKEDELSIMTSFIEASVVHPKPTFDEKYHSDFKNPHWSPSPRNGVAEFICKYGVVNNNLNTENIKQLCFDSVPSVRYLVICELFRVHFYNPALFWELIKQISISEKHDTIILPLLHSVARIFNNDVKKSEKIFALIFEQNREGEVLNFFSRTVVDLSTNGFGKWGEKKLYEMIRNPIRYKKYLSKVSLTLIKNVLEGNEKQDLALEILLELIQQSSDVILKEGIDSESSIELYNVIKNVIERCYFFIDDELGDVPNDDVNLDRVFKLLEHIKEYFNVGGQLDAHTIYLLNKLLFKIRVKSPVFVLNILKIALESNRHNAYRNDSTAAKELVRFVEAFLVEYKELLQSDEDAFKDLVYILECFADVGWPEALNLVWKLDSVYR
jgi:hypothetical protein